MQYVIATLKKTVYQYYEWVKENRPTIIPSGIRFEHLMTEYMRDILLPADPHAQWIVDQIERTGDTLYPEVVIQQYITERSLDTLFVFFYQYDHPRYGHSANLFVAHVLERSTVSPSSLWGYTLETLERKMAQSFRLPYLKLDTILIQDFPHFADSAYIRPAAFHSLRKVLIEDITDLGRKARKEWGRFQASRDRPLLEPEEPFDQLRVWRALRDREWREALGGLRTDDAITEIEKKLKRQDWVHEYGHFFVHSVGLPVQEEHSELFAALTELAYGGFEYGVLGDLFYTHEPQHSSAAQSIIDFFIDFILENPEAFPNIRFPQAPGTIETSYFAHQFPLLTRQQIHQMALKMWDRTFRKQVEERLGPASP